MVTCWPTGRPPLNEWDRLFWIGLSRVWTGWRGALVFVQPDTVVRWQRDRFRRFWARLSRVDGRRAGRPALAQEVRRLILQVAKANPLWRTPRIHGGLKMLGTVVSEGTVSRVLRTISPLRRRLPFWPTDWPCIPIMGVSGCSRDSRGCGGGGTELLRLWI